MIQLFSGLDLRDDVTVDVHTMVGLLQALGQNGICALDSVCILSHDTADCRMEMAKQTRFMLQLGSVVRYEFSPMTCTHVGILVSQILLGTRLIEEGASR